jgi:hypothetical protein
MTLNTGGNSMLLLLSITLLGLSGCATVESTAVYYTPYTLDQYPPKPKDAFVPILGKAPERSHETIGRLAFSSSNGMKFMRRSMEYNARMQGADAVILNNVDSDTQVFLSQVPSGWDYVPYTAYAPYQVVGKKGKVYTKYSSYTDWQPVFTPGYLSQQSVTTTAIDAEMIVFKK